MTTPDATPQAPSMNPPREGLTFDRLNRRLHLYLALFFLPWFLVYGLSSAVFSHPAWFGQGQAWKALFDREYRLDPIPPDADLRPIAEYAWSIIVDAVQLAIIFWIGSGLYMWWKLRRLRLWGLVVLSAGVASFAFFLLKL